VILATSSRSRKVWNLERDPRATLVLHDSRPGCEVCGTSIAGRVEIVRPPDAGSHSSNASTVDTTPSKAPPIPPWDSSSRRTTSRCAFGPARL
jgi:hypothetical protein